MRLDWNGLSLSIGDSERHPVREGVEEHVRPLPNLNGGSSSTGDSLF